jgi:hypothetical protein
MHLTLFDETKKKFNNKFFNLTPEEIMNSKDGVLVEKNRKFLFLSLANLISFLTQILMTILMFFGEIGNFTVSEILQIPLLSSPAFMYSLWFLFYFSQMLFVLRGLVFFKPTIHYKNVLLLKVKFGFILVCLIMSIATVLYAYG